MEKFIVKNGFFFPQPPEGTGAEVKASEEPTELELTPEQRESLVGDGSLVPFEAGADVGEKSEAGADQGEAKQ